MQVICPLCGARDLREFTPRGSAVTIDRPAEGAGADVWNAYLHLRDNPAGPSRELWWHGSGCGAWLVVDRNTITHEILGVTLASEASTA